MQGEVEEPYASERIQAKIAEYPTEHQRDGLASVAERLLALGVPPDVRLHYITAIRGLGRRATESLPGRMERAERERGVLPSDLGAP